MECLVNEPIIVIDWLSISGSFSCFNDMFLFLGIEDSYIADKFESCPPINHYDYGLAYNSDGKRAITLCYGQHKNYVADSEFFGFINLSGRGCRLFETYSKFTYNDIFQIINDNPGFNISRIDLALDIRDKDYPMSRFVKAYDNDLYICSARKCSHIDSKDNNKIHGHSLYFGTQASEARINIYDKRAERGLTERELPDGWIRIELRLRHDNAAVFLERYLNGIPIAQLYFGILTDKLRFLKRSSSDSNKQRWPTAKWWTKLIQNSDRIHLELPGIVYDYGRWETNFFRQCGSRLKLIYQIYTPFQLALKIKEDKSIKLNQDQRFLLDNYIPCVPWYEM